MAAAWVPGGGGAYAACRYGWAAAAPLQPCADGWPIAIVRAALGARQRTSGGEGQTKGMLGNNYREEEKRNVWIFARFQLDTLSSVSTPRRSH